MTEEHVVICRRGISVDHAVLIRRLCCTVIKNKISKIFFRGTETDLIEFTALHGISENDRQNLEQLIDYLIYFNVD